MIGLTGGIASGKSTVTKMLINMGFPVIDADLAAREIVEPGSPVLDMLKNVFGNDIVDSSGRLDRKKLGSIVFNNGELLERLNAVMLPAIRNEIEKHIFEYRAKGCRVCFVDAAILIESNFTDMVDHIILIYINPALQLKRLMERDHCTEGEALGRIHSQMSFEEKRKYADYVLDNSHDVEYTNQQLNRILKEIAMAEGMNG